jgi:hypothetical protein
MHTWRFRTAFTVIEAGSTAKVELWEIEARDAIRDLVVRYNSNGDAGRFAEVMELFAHNAVMVLDGHVRTGHEEILTIFTGVLEHLTVTDATGSKAPTYVRHMTATHQIDLIDRHAARGRCYYQVLTSVGLDHWGRYIDEYRTVDGRWRFTERRVTVDGRSPTSLFPIT